MSPNTKYFLDNYSNVTTPWHVTLNDDKGKVLKVLEDNQAVSEFIKTHAYSPEEHFKFTNSEGVKLDGYYIKPLITTPIKNTAGDDCYGGPEITRHI